MNAEDRNRARADALNKAARRLDNRKRELRAAYLREVERAEADYSADKVKAYERYGTPALTAPSKRKVKK